jgi:PAS domain S-box-containing protein
MKLTDLQIRILAAILGLIFLITDLYVPLGVAAGVPYVAVVLLALWLPSTKDVLVIAILSSTATIAGFLYSQEAGIPWMIAANRLLALAAIWACTIAVVLRINSRNLLQKAKKRAEDLLEISESIVIELDRDMRIVEINNIGCDYLGYDREELIGKVWSKFSAPENQRARSDSMWMDVIAGGRMMPVLNESELFCRSGERRYIMWHNHALYDDEGQVCGTLSSGQDITQAKIAETALRVANDNLENRIEERTRELRLITDILPVQISRFDTEKNYIFVNRTSSNWLATDVNSAQRKKVEDVVGPEIYKKVEPYMDRAIAGEGQKFEAIFTYPDGDKREVRIQYLPDINAGGKITGVIGLVIDLTEHRQVERSLVKSELRYRTIFESGNVGIIRTQLSTGKVIQANDREAQLLGYASREDLLANYSPQKHWYSLDDREDWIRHSAQGNLSWDADVRMVTCQGETVWLHTSSVFRPEEDYVDVISVDITKSKEQELAILAAREEAEFANRAKSEFLANMSHELRTPLNAILGFAQIIRDRMFADDVSARYVEYASDIYDSGEHLLAIINDVLDLSRIEAGKANLRMTTVDVEALVDSCLKLIGGRIAESRQTISKVFSSRGKYLHADERMVRQMLLNLLSNANKFTPVSGHISIETSDSPNGYLKLTVRDSGIGIAKKDIPQVMKPFGQIEGAFTRQFDGSGLGLPLVASLAQLHQGDLTIKSKPGEGTSATIWLPMQTPT